MKQWFVVNTKPKNEERATNNLLHGGIEVLFPKLKLRKYRDGKFVEVIEAMFPSYIFVRFDPIDEFHMIKYTRGVKTIVNFGGKIIPLEDGLIDFIRSRLEDGIGTIKKRGLHRGEKVMIKDGPFKGLSGIFEKELSGEERVAILLDGVNYYAKMTIDRDLLVSIE